MSVSSSTGRAFDTWLAGLSWQTAIFKGFFFFFWVHHKTWNSCSKHRAIFLLLPLQISAHDVLHCRRARQHERKKCGWHSPAGMRQQVQFRLASRAAEYSSLSCWLGHTPRSLLQRLCNGKSALSRAFQHGSLRHQHDDISHHCSATPERLNKHALPSELLNRSPEELRWHAWSSSWTLADVRSARSCHLNRLLRLLEHGAPPSPCLVRSRAPRHTLCNRHLPAILPFFMMRNHSSSSATEPL